MPPSKRKAAESTAVVPRTPPRRIELDNLPNASPKTGERATSMRRTSLAAFVQLGNVRQTESGERLDSMYPTLSVYVPQTSADGRQAVNNAAKYGIPTYAKPLGQNPSHNLLADKNLLCAGKFFTEAKWVNSKEYMAGLPADAYGCLQWNVINTKHGELITAELQSVLTDIGMHRMPTLNMFNMYKIEFLYRRHQSPADGHRQPKTSDLRARFLRICHRGTHALC